MDKMNYINRIREFNRFYTVSLGVVGRHFRESYSLAEARILYEIYTNPGCAAVQLVELLRLDKGYMSRILKRFTTEGLITKQASAEDARVLLLALTEKGKQEAELVISETNAEIQNMLAAYDADTCDEICKAMDVITKYLGKQQ